jgi:Na+/H+ antiporter NhaD/arsenite permease-like protein
MPTLEPAVLSEARIAGVYLVFLASYVVFALGTFPGMKIDRPGAAIVGAVAMVALGAVGPREALGAIDFATVVLLFAMMLIAASLRTGGFFDWVTARVIERLHPHHLLPFVVFTCGTLSAFLVNDIVCLVMTPIVVQMARKLDLPPMPYAIAVATAANVGSAATITGNPQNMLIGSLSGIPYTTFLAHLAPVAVAGLVVNWGLIHWVYLRGPIDRVSVERASDVVTPSARLRMKPAVVLVLVLVAFFAGVPSAMAAALGAAALLVTRTTDPRRIYGEVDWGLLVFFVGLFVIVGGADRAGLTAALLRPAEAWNLHRLGVFVPVTAALSNLVSNVPAVMLLRTLVPGFPDPQAAWLALAMASTLAGNLTITGSVANIIVVERAASEGVHVGFGEYLKVGVPLTLMTLALGSLWLALAR